MKLRLLLFLIICANIMNAATRTRLFVCNNGEDTVSVIDTSNNMVEATITVGTNPSGVVVTSDGTKAYVTNEGSGTVSVINLLDNSVQTISDANINAPRSLAIKPDDSKVYVVNGDSTVVPITLAGNVVGSTIPVGTNAKYIAIDSSGSYAYVPSGAAANVTTIDLSNDAPNTVSFGSYSPSAVAANPTNNNVYIFSTFPTGQQKVTTFNNGISGSEVFVGTTMPPSTSRGMAVTPNGSSLYYSTDLSATDLFYTALPITGFASTFAVGAGSFGIAFESNSKGYVALSNNTVRQINLPNTPGATIAVGLNPTSIAIATTNFPVAPRGCRQIALNIAQKLGVPVLSTQGLQQILLAIDQSLP